MDEIPDAEYKVVEHQIAPPLDPFPQWRFQPLGARHRIRPRAGKRLSPENAWTGRLSIITTSPRLSFGTRHSLR